MLHEKPEELIKSSIESFEIDPDLNTLNRIEDTIAKTNQERNNKLEQLQQRISKSEKELASLNNELELLNQSEGLRETLTKLGDAKNTKDDENIFKIMNAKSIELDNLKITLAKKLADLERQLNSLNLTKVNCSNQQQHLVSEQARLIEDNLLENFDSKIMKINLYKNLGVNVETTANDEDKIIIYDKRADLTSILAVDDKYSDYFITNYIWERLPGA